MKSPVGALRRRHIGQNSFENSRRGPIGVAEPHRVHQDYVVGYRFRGTTMSQSAIRPFASRKYWRGLLAAGAVVMAAPSAKADEGGVPFWLSGQFGSLAATPQEPGWSFANTYYHASASVGGDVAVARQFTIGRHAPGYDRASCRTRRPRRSRRNSPGTKGTNQQHQRAPKRL